MGTYLANGIVQDIVIKKDQLESQGIAHNEVVRQLGKELEINCYNYTEGKDAHHWKIKREMFDDNLAEFLDAQFQMYCDEKDCHMQNVIKELKRTQTPEELMALAESKSFAHFQQLGYITEYIEAMCNDAFDTDIAVNYRLISYFLSGKIIMECYGSILRYFERNIRLQRNKYPIVDCVKVLITD